MKLESLSGEELVHSISSMVSATVLQSIRVLKEKGASEKEAVKEALNNGVQSLSHLLMLAALPREDAKNIVQRAIRVCEQDFNAEIRVDIFDIGRN